MGSKKPERVENTISHVNDTRLPEIAQKHWYRFWQSYSESSIFTAYEFKHYKRIESTLPGPEFQGIYLATIPEELVDGIITSTINRFKELNKPWTWWLGLLSAPENLPEYLEKHGLVLTREQPLMAICLDDVSDPSTPVGLDIRLVEDEKALRDFSKTLAAGNGVPQFAGPAYEIECLPSLWDLSIRRRYVGYEEGEPVSTSAFLIYHNVAGVYQVATVPEARGKRYGTALTLMALKDASQLGVKVAVIHSSDMAYNLYRRMGFKDIGKHCIYQLPPSSSAG